MSPHQWRTTEMVGLIMKTSDNGDSILARIAKRNGGESVPFASGVSGVSRHFQPESNLNNIILLTISIVERSNVLLYN